MTIDDILRRGFLACMADRQYETGTRTNPRMLGHKIGRSSSSLYTWLKGDAGISGEALTMWIGALGLTPLDFLERAVAITRAQTYKGTSQQSARSRGVHATETDARRLSQARDDLLLTLVELAAERFADKTAERLAPGSRRRPGRPRKTRAR
jgi:hypothetical protein